MPFRNLGDAHEASLYRNLVKDLPDYAIFRIGLDGRMESWNAGVERLLGYSETEFLRLPFAAIFNEEDRREGIPNQELRLAAAEGRSLDERWHLHKDGRQFFADGMVTPIVDNSNTVIGYTKVMRDVTDRKLAEEDKQRLAAQLLELAHALDLTHTIIRKFDGTILVWTQGAEFFYGWSPEEARGQRTHDLLKSEFQEPLEKINERLLELGEWQGELRHTTKHGRKVTVASHWVLHTSLDSNVRRVIEVNNDISEVKSIQAELEETNTKLQRANAELTSFAYEVAHDIQSPLRNISTFAELLSRSLGTTSLERQRDLLGQVLQSSSNLRELIADLLQYATVETGQEEIEAVSLDATLEQVGSSLRTAIAAAHADLSWGGMPTVRGHSVRLFRLFQNLISNAIKYARPGVPPVVHVTAERHGRNWLIHVKDNGIGIDAEHSEQVFIPLKRLHGPEISGSGLGLAICRRIAEGEGGRIWVDSTPGLGSTFHVALPA